LLARGIAVPICHILTLVCAGFLVRPGLGVGGYGLCYKARLLLVVEEIVKRGESRV
jgi:hypothetical protein